MVELVLLDYRYAINYTLLFVAAKWTLSPMVELVLLDYRYVINYTILFVAAKWALSESGLLTSPTLTHSSTYVVYIEGRDRIAHSTGRGLRL